MKKILAGILISLMVCSNGFSADRATLQSGSGEELGTASNPIKVSLTGGGSGAPTDATYITQTANGSLSAEQAIGSLATGCLGGATTTGVISARTVTGTANEVSVSNGDCSGNPTLSLPTTIDLGGKTSFEVPNGAAPTVDAFGEIAGDNDLWGAGRGAPVFFDGTASVGLIGALVSDTPSNGQVPTWNTGGTITWETASSGSGDIESVWSVTTGAVTTPTIGTGERLDGGTATADGTNEGILLPRGSAITAATTDGQIAYNTTNDYFGIGNGTSNIPMGMFMFSASQTNSTDPWRKDAFGGGTVAALEGNRTGHALKCGFFYCKTAVAPGAGNSWTCYFNDDNAGAHSCTISDTNLSCTDSTVISVAAESILDFQIAESGTATSTQGMSVSNFCWRA